MKNNHINYIEFKANDLDKIKQFYSGAFNWSFTDYGPDYIAFSESGLDGGFERAEEDVVNGALVVLYHERLQEVKAKIEQMGGRISRDIFEFPGGFRFHFVDPSGNELGVWSETNN